MSKRLVVANWKLYIESPEEAKKFASALRKKSRLFSSVEVVVAPTFPLIPVVAAALKGSAIKVGAQTVSSFEGGAHTGYVSAKTVKNAGASYTIVGHSERRVEESDEVVHAQMLAAAHAGLATILCVGERERDAAGSHFSLIEEQLTSALKNLPKGAASKLVVAYEPVWAIGKSAMDAMKPWDVREMAIFIKKTLAGIFDRTVAMRVPILYGGSVEPDNAHPLITDGAVAGFLVGHASASLDNFVEILKACKK